MRTFFHRAFKSNPTGFISTFGVWSLSVGGSLLAPNDAFETSPAWRSLQLIYARDTEWGILMLIIGLLLLVSIRMNKIPHRAAIALSSAIVWGIIGVSMIANGLSNHIVPIVGVFSLWCSINGLLAVELWVTHSDIGE